MKKYQLALVALVVWLCTVIAFIILTGRVDLEVFFVLWLIGILVIVELIDARFAQARYLQYMKYMIAIGIVIFGGIVAQKILEILSR